MRRSSNRTKHAHYSPLDDIFGLCSELTLRLVGPRTLEAIFQACYYYQERTGAPLRVIVIHGAGSFGASPLTPLMSPKVRVPNARMFLLLVIWQVILMQRLEKCI
mgnify:CR=1 FL=1